MPDQTPEPFAEDELRDIAERADSQSCDTVQAIARELLATRFQLHTAGLTLDRVADELGCTRVQLDLWFARGVVSERDQLRARITELESANANLDEAFRAAADQAHQLAGEWRPPARIITAVADLDALPDDAIIRTRYGTAAQRIDEAWEVPNEVGRCLSEAIDLPAAVLYEPEEAEA